MLWPFSKRCLFAAILPAIVVEVSSFSSAALPTINCSLQQLNNKDSCSGAVNRHLVLRIRGGGKDEKEKSPSTEAGEVAVDEMSTTKNNGNISRGAYSYYLLWSPGFGMKFFLTFFGLMALRLSGTIDRIFAMNFMQSSNVGSDLILPLLSSSCCLIQLLINAFVGASGCAGFNTVLGPFRPTFLAVLTFLTLVVSKPKISVALLRIGLALLPEFIHVWNVAMRSFRTKRRQENVSVLSGSGEAAPIISATMIVDVPTMGCVACINKIDSALQRQMDAKNNIVSAKTWLDSDSPKGGKTKVRFDATSEEELLNAKNQVLQTIEAAGFKGSSVVTLDTHDTR